MRFDKLTIKSQEAVGEAQSLAASRGHPVIEPAHLLEPLLGQPEGSTIPILQKLGVSVDALQREIAGLLESLPKVEGGAQARLSDAMGRVLDAAFVESYSLND